MAFGNMAFGNFFRSKENPAPEPEQQEQKPEELKLIESRAGYVEAHKNYIQSEFAKNRQKDEFAAENIQRGINIAYEKTQIKAEDAERLKIPDNNSTEYQDVVKRRKEFINSLVEGSKDNLVISEHEAELMYNVELSKKKYEAEKIETGKKMKAEGKGQAEIFDKIVLREKQVLNNLMVESWPPQKKNTFRKGMEWWMKQNTATRLVISTALMTGVGMAVSGLTIPAAAIFAASRFAKGGIGAAVSQVAGKTADVAMKKFGSEKIKQEGIAEAKKNFDLDKLKEAEDRVQKAFNDATAKRKKELMFKAGIMMAAGVGTSIGLGWLEKAGTIPKMSDAFKETSPAGGRIGNIPEQPVSTRPAGVVPPGSEDQPISMKPIGPEVPPPGDGVIPVHEIAPGGIKVSGAVENIIEVKSGDSVWKLAERQLEARGYFKGLTGTPEEIIAKRTHLIDAIKDKIAADPRSFGIGSGDADLLHIGDKINFDSIFANQQEVSQAIGAAQNLNSEQIANIVQNNEEIAEWLQAHPGLKLDTEAVEKILHSKSIAPTATETVLEQQIPSVPMEAPIPAPVAGVTEITRDLMLNSIHKDYGIWAGTYDKFSGMKMKDFADLSVSTGAQDTTSLPWQGYNYTEIAKFHKDVRNIYDSLFPGDQIIAAETDVNEFVKKNFESLFAGK